MKELTILGAGLSTQNFIERFRAKNSDSKITIIDRNEFYFKPSRIISEPDNSRERLQISSWADSLNCEFIKASVERINARRKKIYFKQGQAVNFETLIVASGLCSRTIEVKGQHREGFFYLGNIDLFKLKDLFKISKEACIYVSTFLGIRLALAVRSLDKEVTIVAADFDFLDDDKERVAKYLLKNNISLYVNCVIEEAVGESMIKAVKIKPLKVLSCQLVFIDSGFLPQRRFFEEEIRVADNFFTNHQDIFFIGDAACNDLGRQVFFSSNEAQAAESGRIFADYLLDNQPPIFSRPSFYPEDRKKIIDELIGNQEVIEWQSGLV